MNCYEHCFQSFINSNYISENNSIILLQRTKFHYCFSIKKIISPNSSTVQSLSKNITKLGEDKKFISF